MPEALMMASGSLAAAAVTGFWAAADAMLKRPMTSVETMAAGRLEFMGVLCWGSFVFWQALCKLAASRSIETVHPGMRCWGVAKLDVGQLLSQLKGDGAR